MIDKWNRDDILEGENAVAAAIVIAGELIAYELKMLGNADAVTPMGAIETHGAVISQAIESLADAVELLAKK